jgi:hypothetical protein
VRNLPEPETVMVCGHRGTGFPVKTSIVEVPGTYYYPLIATLITGAARLMLGLAEALAEQEGLTWAFCDTDSMAFAQPEGMDEETFQAACRRVLDWFTGLNPYAGGGELFKIEDANWQVESGKPVKGEPAPLYCFAISAKRYALFNLEERRPVLRKVSAHGLGHLLPPYEHRHPSLDIPEPVVSLHDLEVKQWQYDLWYRIVELTLGPTPMATPVNDLPGFAAPAVSRYAATMPSLLAWFKRFNRGKAYRDRVKPFSFLLAYLPANSPTETGRFVRSHPTTRT